MSKHLTILVVCCYLVPCFAMTPAAFEDLSSAKGMCGQCCDVGAGDGCAIPTGTFPVTGVTVCPVKDNVCDFAVVQFCYEYDVTYQGDKCISEGAGPEDNCATSQETPCMTYSNGFCWQSYDENQEENGCLCGNWYEGPKEGGVAKTCSRDGASWDICD